MIQNERELRHETVLHIARQMMTSARTAPKGKGVDVIEIALITDDDIRRLSEEMIAIHEENGFKFFLRVLFIVGKRACGIEEWEHCKSY